MDAGRLMSMDGWGTSLSMRNVRYHVEDDGIAIITWDLPGRATNILTPDSMDEFRIAIENVVEDRGVTGAILRSCKKDFIVGMQLPAAGLELPGEGIAGSERERIQAFYNNALEFSMLLRRMEKCDKPFVAAIYGSAFGVGLEICLACHYRIACTSSEACYGLPEAGIGLMQSGGGTQRLPRLIGAGAAVPMLLYEKTLSQQQALEAGILDKIVTAEELAGEARGWILRGGSPVQPWDRRSFQIPGGGPYSTEGGRVFNIGNAILRKKTYGNHAAREYIMSAVYEGLLVPMDQALRIEGRYVTKLRLNLNTQSVIRSLSFPRRRLGRYRLRPRGSQKDQVAEGIVIAGRVRHVGIEDGPGLFTWRCLAAYVLEGVAVLSEGVDPALIENTGKMTGMLRSPLALADEFGLDRLRDAIEDEFTPTSDENEIASLRALLERMVCEFGRKGTLVGGGFYDHPTKGKPRIWPSLVRVFPPQREQPKPERLKPRFLYIQALEASRCLEEGIIDDVCEADAGAIQGWGFPSWTGGPFSFIDRIGSKEYCEACENLASKYGRRFTPNALLRRMATKGSSFYNRTGSDAGGRSSSCSSTRDAVDEILFTDRVD